MKYIICFLFIWQTHILLSCDKTGLTETYAIDGDSYTSNLIKKRFDNAKDSNTFGIVSIFDKRSGIGEKVGGIGYLKETLKINKGNAPEKSLKEYNRVKKLKMIYYEAELINEKTSQCLVPLRLLKRLGEQVFDLKDEMKVQEFPIDNNLFQKVTGKNYGYIVLEVIEIYKGEKFDQTVVPRRLDEN